MVVVGGGGGGDDDSQAFRGLFLSLPLPLQLEMSTEDINKPPPPLPSYPEMILTAIEGLNSQNGSNKSTISKYIESKYGRLPAGHNALLSHHLNKMKETGELIFFKNNYLKNGPDAPPRRGRGRPPKPKDALHTSLALGPAKPRGRPPKDPSAPPMPKVAKIVLPSASGRPRGRPPKTARFDGNGEEAMEAAAAVRPRGRPPKAKTPSIMEEEEEEGGSD